MARFGVQFEDIANAADQILAKGKEPTIELIRNLLGTGSTSTIATHLRQWRQEREGTITLSRTENLPKEMIATMKGLWDQLCTTANHKFTTNELKYQQEIAELQQELQKYKTNNQRWQQLFNQWQQEKEKLVTDKLTLEQGIESLQKENAVLETKFNAQIEQLQEKQIRIEELHRLQNQTQTNLEHYRESVREQRIIEQEQFEMQKQELQLEIKTLKSQLLNQQEKIQAIHQQHQSLQQTIKILENTNIEVSSKLAKQQKEILASQKIQNELEYKNQHWQKQCEEYQINLNIKIKECIDKETDNKLLLKQISDMKQFLNDLKDQNKLLANEKWVLGQEKAQLEGQLKQFKVKTNE